MPLTIDKNYRGARAVHVHRYYKLGKHLTVIKDAFALVDWLVDQAEVARVDLGRMASAYGGMFTPRIICEVVKNEIRLFLVSKNAAQKITITTTRKSKAADKIALEIKWRWA